MRTNPVKRNLYNPGVKLVKVGSNHDDAGNSNEKPRSGSRFQKFNGSKSRPFVVPGTRRDSRLH